jgi:hypothetical protein
LRAGLRVEKLAETKYCQKGHRDLVVCRGCKGTESSRSAGSKTSTIGTGNPIVTFARTGKLGKDFRSGKKEGWLRAPKWEGMFPYAVEQSTALIEVVAGRLSCRGAASRWEPLPRFSFKIQIRNPHLEIGNKCAYHLQIRKSKSEIRNKFEYRNPKPKTINVAFVSNFGFRICFGFRYSDFGFSNSDFDIRIC